MAVLVGKTLTNRYRIEESLGQGGMAEVYKAWDAQRATYLALKVLRQDLARDRIFLRRFQREAQTLEKLQHPNIVRFYGIETDDLTVFMLMEYIEGSTLQDEIFRADGQPLKADFIKQVMASVCSALHYAHQQGLVHCDIKPGNIMLNQHRQVLLTDFGIARMTDAATSTMVGFGTPAYMAPELVRGQDPTPQSDIYSLGVVLYELVTGGERPFTGERAQTTGTTSEKVRWEQVHLAPISPRVYKTTVSSELEAVILHCLAKDPAARHDSALDLLNAVERVMGVVRQPVPDSNAIGPTPRQAEPHPYQTPGKDSGVEVGKPAKALTGCSPKKPLPGWVPWVGAGVIILGLICLGAALLLSWTNYLSRDRKGQPEPMGVVVTSNEQSPVIEGINLETTSTVPISPETPDLTTTHTSPTEGQTAHFSPTATPVLLTATEAIPAQTVTSSLEDLYVDVKVNPKDGMLLVFVPEGQFVMGSNPAEDPYFWGAEGPAHEVFVDAFWIYQTEVTNAIYQACMAEKACPKPLRNESRTVADYYNSEKYAHYPVIQVNWVQAVAYCQWAGGRLPTEAEWEKAARGTDGRLFPWGNSPLTPVLASFCGTSCPGDERENFDDGYPEIAPVGMFPAGASPYGALDMAGNVWEWVFDYFDINYYSISPYDNPRGPLTGNRRVIRGGSWFNPIDGLRTVSRASLPPQDGLDTVGFRCVMEGD